MHHVWIYDALDSVQDWRACLFPCLSVGMPHLHRQVFGCLITLGCHAKKYFRALSYKILPWAQLPKKSLLAQPKDSFQALISCSPSLSASICSLCVLADNLPSPGLHMYPEFEVSIARFSTVEFMYLWTLTTFFSSLIQKQIKTAITHSLPGLEVINALELFHNEF